MEHNHQIPTHNHGGQAHDHGGVWSHDHSEDVDPGHGPEDFGVLPDHDHTVPPGYLWRPDLVTAVGTTCGHLGGGPDDPGVQRTVIHHRGREWVLCGGCAGAFDWEAADAVVEAGRIPGRGGQHGPN